MEAAHFWLEARRGRIDELLRRFVTARSDVLDVGCGTGWLVERLHREGHTVTGLEARPEWLDELRARLPDVRVLQADAEHMPIDDASIDVVLLLDVLEHVDDRAVLGEGRRVLRPGGIALITVPAMPRLWSFRDIDAGHRRRYTRRGLRQLLESAGFEALEVRYHGALLLPLIAASRLLGRAGGRMRDLEDRPPASVNATLRQLARIDHALCRRFRLPLGSSLVAAGLSAGR
jgi:SAM-dependent methyltransferase